MENKLYLELVKCSNLLKRENVKRIIEEKLEGYTLEEMKIVKKDINASFYNKTGNIIHLSISENGLTLIEQGNMQIEGIEIDDASLVERFICERRPNGVIVTKIKEVFDNIGAPKRELCLVELKAERFVFSDRKLGLFFNKGKLDLLEIYESIRSLLGYFSIKHIADGYNSFSTMLVDNEQRRSTSLPLEDNRGARKKIGDFISNSTFVNSEDVSSTFDVICGKDCLYRIYDLYNGIINQRTLSDVKEIYLGVLPPDVFDLKTVIGITEQEDRIVGPSMRYKLFNKINLDNVLNGSTELKGELGCERGLLISLNRMKYYASDESITDTLMLQGSNSVDDSNHSEKVLNKLFGS